MAQTKRRRRTKHRGNAAGIIEARGRTGRAPSAGAKGKDGKKIPRADRPPEWRSAFTRASIATIVLMVVALVFLHSGSIVYFFPVVLGLYTVIGYYTDKFLYDRRQRQKAAGKIAS